MNDVLSPHLAIPLRLAGGKLAVVEQDTLDEVAGCVEAIVRTPVGFRDEQPRFGIEEQALREGGPDLAGIERAVQRFEPRAELVLEENIDDWHAILVRAGIRIAAPAGTG